MAAIGWTPAILNKMKALLDKGLSTAEIGKKIGMSKNAVVGKLNRLGWNPKAQDIPVKKTAAKKEIIIKVKPPKKTVTAKKTPAKLALEKKAAEKKESKGSVKIDVKSSPKSLAAHQHMIQHALELATLRPDQCHWPIGNPDSDRFHFCGAPVFVGKPYCYEHCRAAYQMMPPKK